MTIIHQANEKKTTSKQVREAGTKFHQIWHKINPTYSTGKHKRQGTQNQSFSLRTEGLKPHIRHQKF